VLQVGSRELEQLLEDLRRLLLVERPHGGGGGELGGRRVWAAAVGVEVWAFGDRGALHLGLTGSSKQARPSSVQRPPRPFAARSRLPCCSAEAALAHTILLPLSRVDRHE
jgi:hypothetical protein